MDEVKRIRIRNLHRETEAILEGVARGKFEDSGLPVAELRPYRTNLQPDREDLISTMPKAKDSGRILEEDRS